MFTEGYLYLDSGDLRASIWQSFAAKTDSSSRIEIRYDSSDTGEGSFVIMVESEIIDHEYLQLEEEPLEISGEFFLCLFLVFFIYRQFLVKHSSRHFPFWHLIPNGIWHTSESNVEFWFYIEILKRYI